MKNSFTKALALTTLSVVVMVSIMNTGWVMADEATVGLDSVCQNQEFLNTLRAIERACHNQSGTCNTDKLKEVTSDKLTKGILLSALKSEKLIPINLFFPSGKSRIQDVIGWSEIKDHFDVYRTLINPEFVVYVFARASKGGSQIINDSISGQRMKNVLSFLQGTLNVPCGEYRSAYFGNQAFQLTVKNANFIGIDPIEYGSNLATLNQSVHVFAVPCKKLLLSDEIPQKPLEPAINPNELSAKTLPIKPTFSALEAKLKNFKTDISVSEAAAFIAALLPILSEQYIGTKLAESYPASQIERVISSGEDHTSVFRQSSQTIPTGMIIALHKNASSSQILGLPRKQLAFSNEKAVGYSEKITLDNGRDREGDAFLAFKIPFGAGSVFRDSFFTGHWRQSIYANGAALATFVEDQRDWPKNFESKNGTDIRPDQNYFRGVSCRMASLFLPIGNDTLQVNFAYVAPSPQPNPSSFVQFFVRKFESMGVKHALKGPIEAIRQFLRGK